MKLSTPSAISLNKCYQDAREQASDDATKLSLETFPTQPPFTPEETLDSEYLNPDQ
ncbi:MAG: DUF29 family protein [Microcoleaceae cyanobacterium]